MREDFEVWDRRERSGAGAVIAALLLGTAAAVALVLWWRRKEEDGGTGGPPPGESLCPVDAYKEARITLDAHGNVRGFERTIPIKIVPGDTRRWGVKWIVNNRHGAAAREVHMGNMRRGSKAGGREDIFESGSDRAVIAAGQEQYFFSCILSNAAEGNYFYDILVDGKIKIDPEIAIIRR